MKVYIIFMYYKNTAVFIQAGLINADGDNGDDDAIMIVLMSVVTAIISCDNNNNDNDSLRLTRIPRPLTLHSPFHPFRSICVNVRTTFIKTRMYRYTSTNTSQCCRLPVKSSISLLSFTHLNTFCPYRYGLTPLTDLGKCSRVGNR